MSAGATCPGPGLKGKPCGRPVRVNGHCEGHARQQYRGLPLAILRERVPGGLTTTPVGLRPETLEGLRTLAGLEGVELATYLRGVLEKHVKTKGPHTPKT